MLSIGKKLLLAVVAMLATGVLYSAPAYAQATRTWVSGVGDDANPCSRTAPCKTFAGAISKTATGGEIDCLDPAGFGALTITKSITIDCTGTLGSVLAAGTTGFILNGANINVVLRGVTVNGSSTVSPGINGIRFLQGASLTIEDSLISNFNAASPNGFGILVNPTSGTSRLIINNTVIVNNGTGVGGGGISVSIGGSATVLATLRNVQIVGNANVGLFANSGSTGNISATLDTVVVSGSGTAVFANQAAGAGAVVVTVVNSTIADNVATGLSANGSGARIRLGNSTITNSGTAASASGGAVINTYGNNYVNGNASDGTFTLPVLPTT